MGYVTLYIRRYEQYAFTSGDYDLGRVLLACDAV